MASPLKGLPQALSCTNQTSSFSNVRKITCVIGHSGSPLKKSSMGPKPIQIEPVQLGLQLEPLWIGEPGIVLGDNPRKAVQLFERHDRAKRSVIDQKKSKRRMQSPATRTGSRPLVSASIRQNE
jgi:hypothetical protein